MDRLTSLCLLFGGLRPLDSISKWFTQHLAPETDYIVYKQLDWTLFIPVAQFHSYFPLKKAQHNIKEILLVVLWLKLVVHSITTRVSPIAQ